MRPGARQLRHWSALVAAWATLVVSSCILGPQPEIPGEPANGGAPDMSGGVSGTGGQSGSTAVAGGSNDSSNGADAGRSASPPHTPEAMMRADAGAYGAAALEAGAEGSAGAEASAGQDAGGAASAARDAAREATADGASGASDSAPDALIGADASETGVGDRTDAAAHDGRARDGVGDASPPRGDARRERNPDRAADGDPDRPTMATAPTM